MVLEAESIDGPQAGSEPRLRKDEWMTATEILRQLLGRNDGCVGSVVVGKELGKKGLEDPRRVVLALKFYDFETSDDSRPNPGFKWKHHGRSFYTEEAFKRTLTRTESQAESAAEQAAVPLESAHVDVQDHEDEEPIPVKRSNRKEEARLVTYVVDSLSDLYDSDPRPDNRAISFDVHNERAGTDFENVDAIAIHWRSKEVVDLIAIEAKLQFSAMLVQQANNYRRFADRVWVAIPVQAPVGKAALELRELNARLFDYVISLGIGVLACHKRRGGRYEIFPVQWPGRCFPDPIERHEFIERNYETFEEAGVVEPRNRGMFPRVR